MLLIKVTTLSHYDAHEIREKCFVILSAPNNNNVSTKEAIRTSHATWSGYILILAWDLLPTTTAPITSEDLVV